MSDWFNGKTTALKLRPAIGAAKLWGCDPLWLGEGDGSPRWESRAATPRVDLADALPVVLAALAELAPVRAASVRAQIELVMQRPDLRDDVLRELLSLLRDEPGKRPRVA